MPQQRLRLFLYLTAILFLVAHGASAEEALCGAPPALPDVLRKDEAIKGQLQGQADFLSKLVGKAELSGQVEATMTIRTEYTIKTTR